MKRPKNHNNILDLKKYLIALANLKLKRYPISQLET